MPDKRLKDALNKPPAPPGAALQRGTPYQVGQAAAVREPELPPQLGLLSPQLQEYARQYIGARRRSGEALLDAARWLTEARRSAEHGEWQLFLEATSTSSDTAERLLNIHARAIENPQFAEAVARNWLGQSAAALLARPSTPPEIVDQVLQSDTRPTTANIEQHLKAARSAPAPDIPSAGPTQIPQIAEFERKATKSGPNPDQVPPAIRADLIEALARIARREGRDINAVLEDAIEAYRIKRKI